MAGTKVKVQQKDGGREKSLNIKHAEDLLNLVNSQWQLNDDKFIFKDGKIAPKPSKSGTTNG